MDWVERWFGVAPDNGDGSLELLLTLCVVAAAPIIAASLHRRTRISLQIWASKLGEYLQRSFDERGLQRLAVTAKLGGPPSNCRRRSGSTDYAAPDPDRDSLKLPEVDAI
jgi:hypothetical protein